MNNFFHFNAFPEAAICLPEYDDQGRLMVFIPLITNSTKGDLLILKKEVDNILDLKYYLKYKPSAHNHGSSIKFMCTSIKEDFSNINFIRHKVYFIDSNSELSDNLSNYPFEKTYNQPSILSVDPIPTRPFSLLNLNNTESYFELPIFSGADPNIIEDIRNRTITVIDELSDDKLIKVVDSCTIPPEGGSI